jgi:hypothetical protein
MMCVNMFVCVCVCMCKYPFYLAMFPLHRIWTQRYSQLQQQQYQQQQQQQQWRRRRRLQQQQQQPRRFSHLSAVPAASNSWKLSGQTVMYLLVSRHGVNTQRRE